jgi:hypothetical protein
MRKPNLRDLNTSAQGLAGSRAYAFTQIFFRVRLFTNKVAAGYLPTSKG